jgi:hypothetical protein
MARKVLSYLSHSQVVARLSCINITPRRHGAELRYRELVTPLPQPTLELTNLKPSIMTRENDKQYYARIPLDPSVFYLLTKDRRTGSVITLRC